MTAAPMSFRDDAPDPGKPSDTSVLTGGRWALRLVGTLLVAFALIDLLHWRSAASPTALETVVQQPVPADNTPPDTRSDVTAPDPGDNP